MKRLLLALGILLLWAYPVMARDISLGRSSVPRVVYQIKKPIARKLGSLLARVTVYWAKGSGSDRDTRRHKAATGARLTQGSCAVDPRRIPYGSKVILPDNIGLRAVDTGTAVVNRKAARRSGHTTQERAAVVIDRFFETKGEALAWASQHPLFCFVQIVLPSGGL